MTTGGRRILLVARGLDEVGTGRQLSLTAEGLRNSGWEPHIATLTGCGTLAGRLAARGHQLHRLSRRPGLSTASAAGLARLIRRLRPRVVESWGWSAAGITAAVAPAGGPRLLSVLATAVMPVEGWRRAALGRLIARQHAVLAATPEVTAICRGLAGDRLRHVPLPPVILTPPPASLSRQAVARLLGWPAESCWTCTVAPLLPRSRLERLVWAVDQLDVVLPGLRHLLVGRGPLAARLARRARAQQAAGRLTILPECDFLESVLPECRLVWQTGEVAYGGAVLEARSLGVPAVAIDSPSARGCIIDGDTGRIVASDPPSELPRRALPILEEDATFHKLAEGCLRHLPSMAASLEPHLAVIEEAAG